jgi:hypothetical protein
LGKIPPDLSIATGYDDDLMLFLLCVRDAKAAAEILMDVITLSEYDATMSRFTETGGLVRKRLQFDEAWQVRERLESTGTTVQFVRPDDIEEPQP